MYQVDIPDLRKPGVSVEIDIYFRKLNLGQRPSVELSGEFYDIVGQGFKVSDQGPSLICSEDEVIKKCTWSAGDYYRNNPESFPLNLEDWGEVEIHRTSGLMNDKNKDVVRWSVDFTSKIDDAYQHIFPRFLNSELTPFRKFPDDKRPEGSIDPRAQELAGLLSKDGAKAGQKSAGNFELLFRNFLFKNQKQDEFYIYYGFKALKDKSGNGGGMTGTISLDIPAG